MMIKNIIHTDKAPAAVGPYSQAVEVNGLLYTSGVIPIVPETGLIPEGIEEQAEQVCSNISNLLEDSGSSMEQVIKSTVFIKDMNDFAKINAIYSNYFKKPYPARSCVEVARLPKDVLIEMEVIAIVQK